MQSTSATLCAPRTTASIAGPSPEAVEPKRLIAVVPAAGWWALYVDRIEGKYEWRTTRRRVAAWGHFVGGVDFAGDVDGWSVVALVAGDTEYLVPAHEVFGTGVHQQYPERLWHDGDSFCTCRHFWLDPRTCDDITWCEQCAGVIEQAQ